LTRRRPMVRRKKTIEKVRTRPSTLVSRQRLPGPSAREELTRLLRAHDPEIAAANLVKITDRFLPLLRQIAQETPVTNTDPVLRRHAIAQLGRLAGTGELNLLAEIARLDPDPAVRAESILALGTSGLVLAAPTLAQALSSTEPSEVTAASKGIGLLARKVGSAAVRLQVQDVSPAIKRVLDRVLAGEEEKTVAGTPRKPSQTRGD
jgi:HEAT repeat protein